MKTPARADFLEWLDNPVTEFVLAAVRNAAEGQKAEFSDKAWAGDLDPLTRERYVTRADSLAGLADLTYDAALELMGTEEPKT